MDNPEKKQMIARPGKITVAVIFGGILLFCIICPYIMIGPGLPPDQNFAATMVSPQSMIFQNCSAAEKNTETEPEFCVEQVSLEYYPEFRELTPTASYVIFRNMTTSRERVAAFWQFTDKDDFDLGSKQLCKYLEDHGSVSVTNLDLDEEKMAIRNIHRKYPDTIINQIPQQVTGASYAGNDTAGYFFVVNQPVSESREDFFIAYFGLVGDTNLQANSSDLEYLIAIQGDAYYLFNSNVLPLECSETTIPTEDFSRNVSRVYSLTHAEDIDRVQQYDSEYTDRYFVPPETARFHATVEQGFNFY